MNDLLAVCRCGCPASVHDTFGGCECCLCDDFRNDDHTYPVGMMVTS